MRLACIGGGPGGLFLAARLRSLAPSIEVDLFERNGRDTTFGFGVVFSDETLDGIAAADPDTFALISAEFRSWSEIDVCRRGERVRSTGHGFSAISRLRLLQILADRATERGARLHFERDVAGADLDGYDVVVAADGVHSATRVAGAEVFQPIIETGTARFIWLGSRKVFDAFTFLFEQTPHGVVQAHCYPYDEKTSTVVVEMDEATWRRSGLDTAGPIPAGDSDEAALAFAETVFGQHLDGEGVIGNASVWRTFPTVRCDRWHDGRVVLLGDAVHTAHFSVGSGTKLALEDAIVLAEVLAEASAPEDIPAALDRYQEQREPMAASLQRAADTSAAWFSSVHRYVELPMEQFVFQLLTRSQRITYDNLELRDPDLVRRIRRWFHGSRPPAHRAGSADTPPMFYPFTLRDLRLDNRVVVSPMAQYSAVDGVPDEWHLVHLGSRAVGGAGLVMTEMTCVSPDGRITPGCTGLWDDAQQEAWAPIVDFVHRHTPAKIGLQLGHAGRKGSCKVPWEGDGDDEPLDEGNWPLLAPSAIAWDARNQVPAAMDRSAMDLVVEQHAAAARRGVELGFDLLELHFAHGYLMSSFLSPLCNLRTDAYGGAVGNRLRYPLEVVAAVREVWPDHLPLSVRFSATDWMAGGNDGDDAVAIAGAVAAAGVDVVDVSTGQVHAEQRPRYGRLYQTPFSDRIRQEVGIPAMTVGAVSSVDDVNTILLSGRADLCLLARSHLVDPYWTLNAAIDQGYSGHPWPVQYLSGKTARRREQDPLRRLGDGPREAGSREAGPREDDRADR